MKVKPKLGLVSSNGLVRFVGLSIADCDAFMHYHGLKCVPHAPQRWVSEGFYSVPGGCARKQGAIFECGLDGTKGVPSKHFFEASYQYVSRPEMSLTKQDHPRFARTYGGAPQS